MRGKRGIFKRVLALALAVLMTSGLAVSPSGESRIYASNPAPTIRVTEAGDGGDDIDTSSGEKPPTPSKSSADAADAVYQMEIAEPGGPYLPYHDTEKNAYTFTAEIQKTEDGEQTKVAENEGSIMWYVSGSGGSSFTREGWKTFKYQIPEGTPANTDLTITATYKPDGTAPAVSASIVIKTSISVRVAGKILDSYTEKGAREGDPLEGVRLTFSDRTEDSRLESVTVDTAEDGSYEVYLISGRTYSVTAEREDYSDLGFDVDLSAITTEDTCAQEDMKMKTSLKLCIEGPESMASKGQSLTFTVSAANHKAWPDQWPVEWHLSEDGTGHVTAQTGADTKSLTVTGTGKTGTVTVGASSHGTDAEGVTVTIVPAGITGTVSIGREPSGDAPFVVGDTLKAKVEYKLSDSDRDDVITDGSVTYSLQKKIDENTYYDIALKDNCDLPLSPDSGAYDLTAYIKTIGTYRIIASYSGDNFECHDVSCEFDVAGRTGQSITFDEGNPERIVYDEKNITTSISFNAIVAADAKNSGSAAIREQIADEDYWTIRYDDQIITEPRLAIDREKVTPLNDRQDTGLYQIEGTLTFGAIDVAGDTTISLSYTDALPREIENQGIDSETQVYKDAAASYQLEIKPKTIEIDDHLKLLEDKIYDGTAAASVTGETIALTGVVNDDVVSVNIQDAILNDINAGEGRYLDLKEDGAKTGTSITLTGEDASKYRLSLDNIQRFTCSILPKTLEVDLSDLEIKADYYTPKDELLKMIVQAVRENRAVVFKGFVEADENNGEDLRDCIVDHYMPVFSTMADKNSGTGDYAISADNPETSGAEKPAELNNYAFDLRGEKVGTLTIISRDIAASEYDLAPEAQVCYSDEGGEDHRAIWVGRENIALSPFCVSDPEASGYNTVYYGTSAADIHQTEIDLDDPADGEFYMVMAQVCASPDGTSEEIARSNPKAIYYHQDIDTSVEITVDAVQNSGSFIDRVLEVLTLGIFGKNTAEATITGRDEKSGLASVQYMKADYSEAYAHTSGKSDAEIETYLQGLDWEGEGTGSKNVRFNDGRYVVFAKAVDNVGNIRYVGTNGIVIDSVAPAKLNIRIENGRDIDVYNEDVTISFEVSDIVDQNAPVYSGIKEVSYSAMLNGRRVPSWEGSKKYDVDGSQPTEDALREKAMDKTTGAFTLPCGGIVSTAANAVNRVDVTVTARDYADNVCAAKTLSFDYDVAKPEIDVSFDGDPKNDRYFNEDRAVTVRVTDAYFGRDGYGRSEFSGTEYAMPAEGYSGGWRDLGGYTYEMRYVYSISRDHTFDVSVTDAAGNVSGMSDLSVPAHYKNFVVDQIAPRMTSAKYFIYVGQNTIEVTQEVARKQRYYGNNRIFSEITFEEHNFEPRDTAAGGVGGVSVEIQAFDSSKAAVTAVTSCQWTRESGDTHVLRVDYISDANYTFDVSCTDKAGNAMADYAVDHLTVDTAAPTAKISLSNHKTPWEALVSAITFGIFSNKDETATISEAFDATSDVKRVSCLVSHDPMTWSELDAASQWTDGASVTLSPDAQRIVYGRIEDNSGNYTYISTDGVVLDDTIDKPQIDIAMPEPLNHIYNSDVDVKIKVVDPDPQNNHDYSGLKSVYYEVRNKGAVTQSGNFNIAAGAARQRSAEETIVIDAEKNNSNDVEVYVRATDNSDNVSEGTLRTMVDVTRPVISVTFDNQSPVNGKYYRDARVATVTIRERNFDPNNVRITVTSTDGAQPAISGWSPGVSAGASDDETHTATITFAADGDYRFTVDDTDLAGNVADAAYTSEDFTIDRTPPVLSVSYDNNSASNGTYYRAARIATITVVEHNFSAGEVRVETTASRGESAPFVGAWSDSGDRHTATVSFGGDSDYTLNVSYTDLAGNAAARDVRDRFTVDLTEPELSITGVRDQSANRGTVSPVITASDANFSGRDVELLLTGVNRGRVDISDMITTANTADGRIITFLNFGRDMDDIYTLTAKTADLAGNEATERVTFSVNRNGSTYRVSDATRQLLRNPYTNSPKDIVIEEINVDTLEFVELTYARDGRVVKLNEGTDYWVGVEKVNGGWKKYTYTISASCFEAEGAYSINIYSEDRAANNTTNKAKAVDIEFVVDRTPPSLVMGNLDADGLYREDSHEFTLSVRDNALLEKVVLIVDGQRQAYEGDALNEVLSDGLITFKLDSRRTVQTVAAEAYDAAGNRGITDPAKFSVFVNPSAILQFYMNKPLFFGSIAGLSALIAIVIVAIVSLRRKKDRKRRGK